MQVFTTRPYKQDADIEISRTILNMLVGAVTGIVCGAVGAIFTAHVFSFPIIFNALIGVAIAAAMTKANHFTKVRVPFVMALGALFAGLFAVGTLHVGEYLSFKSSLGDAPKQDLQLALSLKAHDRNQIQLPKAILEMRPVDPEDIEYIELLQVESLSEYMLLTAKQGIELGRPGRQGGINLGFYGSIGYWVFEALILIAIAISVVWVDAKKPFCEDCDDWMPSNTIGEMIADPKRVVEILESGDFSSLTLTLPGVDQTTLALYRCNNCCSENKCVVRVNKVKTTNGTQHETAIADFVLDDEAVLHLMKTLGLDEGTEEEVVLNSVREISVEANQAAALAEPAAAAQENPEDVVNAYMANLLKAQREN